ncbi:MAG: hypothetical protein KC449_15440, partial [Anaerolineales bacterium]|nr:hypothetical protein [Anaerolineales bacterium]
MESAGEILKKSYANQSQTNIETLSSDSPLPDDSAEASGLGQPDCPLCDGLGYVIPDVPPVDPRFGRAVACTCRAAEREIARIDGLMKLSQLGALQNCTFDAFLP